MKNTFLGLAFLQYYRFLHNKKQRLRFIRNKEHKLSTRKFTDSLPNIWELVFTGAYG